MAQYSAGDSRTGPTIALFAMTDPRRIVARPDWREALEVARGSFRRGWLITLVFLSPVAILIRNLTYFGVSGSPFSSLAIFWAALLLIFCTIGAWAFAVAGLRGVNGRAALRGGARLVATHPVRAVSVSIVCWLLLALSALLIIPLIMFAPAMIAAIVNRCVLDGLGIEVEDPLEPTAERHREDRVRRFRPHRG
ncbi:MAG: hypothetical protein M3R06_00240 [Chloroflexota bacterium]|nr:hypothetical protein [Chloroflexota bacterium]